jgi:chemotaxis protein histidine kinase CheA
MLGPAHEIAERIAYNYDKAVRLELRGASTSVNLIRFLPLMRSMVQLIRNAVVHGIEPSHERAAKPACGLIIMSFAKSDDTLTITVKDDGRGVQFDRLRKIMVTKKFVSPEAAAIMAPARLMELIFEPGVSTEEQKNVYAGQGVGLTALRQNVVVLGGSIWMESAEGEGTTVNIRVPLAADLRERAAS